MSHDEDGDDDDDDTCMLWSTTFSKIVEFFMKLTVCMWGTENCFDETSCACEMEKIQMQTYLWIQQ